MKVNKEGLAIIRNHSGKKITIKQLDPYIQMVSEYDTDYEFNENEFSALVSLAQSGVSIKELTLDTRRSKYQISNKIGSYVFNNSGEYDPDLKLRRKEEYELLILKYLSYDIYT